MRRVILLVIIWAVVRIPFGVLFYALPVETVGDSLAYEKPVQDLLEGKGYTSTSRPPAYPLLMYATYKVLGRSEESLKWVHYALNLATVLLLYWVGRKAFSEKIAFAAAVIASVNPFAIFVDHMVLSESLFLFLIVLTMALVFWAYGKGGLWPFLVVGACIGFATLTKPVVLLLPFFLAIPFYYRFRNIRPTVAATALTAFATGMVLLPFMLYNKSHNNYFGISALRGINLALISTTYTEGDIDLPFDIGIRPHISSEKTLYEVRDSMLARKIAVRDGDSVYYRQLTHVEIDSIFGEYARDKTLFANPVGHFKGFLIGTKRFWSGYWIAYPQFVAWVMRIPLGPDEVPQEIRRILKAPYFRLLQFGLSFGVLLFFLVFGPAGLRGLTKNVYRITLAVTIAYVALLSCAVTTVTPRYRFPVEPFIWLFCVAGAVNIYNAVRKRAGRPNRSSTPRDQA